MYAHQLLCLIKDKRKSQAARSQTRRLCPRKVVKKYSRLWYYCGQTKNHRQIGGDFSQNGGLEGDRTLDLSDANRTLSQLSYEPVNTARSYYIKLSRKCKGGTENFLRIPVTVSRSLALPMPLTQWRGTSLHNEMTLDRLPRHCNSQGSFHKMGGFHVSFSSLSFDLGISCTLVSLLFVT